MKVSDKIPESEEEEEVEVVATVQQAVSYFTSNFNKVHMEVISYCSTLSSLQSDCTINLIESKGENYVLSATLDEWISFRMKKNMSSFMLWKEKVYIYVVLEYQLLCWS